MPRSPDGPRRRIGIPCCSRIRGRRCPMAMAATRRAGSISCPPTWRVSDQAGDGARSRTGRGGLGDQLGESYRARRLSSRRHDGYADGVQRADARRSPGKQNPEERDVTMELVAVEVVPLMPRVAQDPRHPRTEARTRESARAPERRGDGDRDGHGARRGERHPRAVSARAARPEAEGQRDHAGQLAQRA